jgi:hypothetical protein
VLSGSLNPVGGWVSPSYGQLLAAPQLRFAVENGCAATSFCIEHDPTRVTHMSCELSQAGARVLRVTATDFNDLIVIMPHAVSREVLVDGIEFCGKALWLRERRNGKAAISTHACTRLRSSKYDIDVSFTSVEDFDAECVVPR